MFRLDTKASTEALEEKTYYGAPSASQSFPEFLANSGEHQLSAYAAYKLYLEAMPFFNAVDMRATAFSQIPLKLYDKVKEEFITDHPALDLLRKPNADSTCMELLYALCTNLDVTGDSFIGATGQVGREPLELFLSNALNVSFGAQDTKFSILNIPTWIQISNHLGVTQTYTASEENDQIRYMNQMQNREMWHIRNYNPYRENGNFYGMSKARPLWYELQQYVAGNKNNLSTLKRGTRLSMAWVNNSEHELTNTQWERMQAEAQKYSGETNAGGTPILDGMDVRTVQQTNRDMEFGQLQDKMLSRVSNVYGIPLALLLEGTMTYSNLETAMLHFYDLTVLPLTKRIYEELSYFLLPRYKNSENLVFAYNENDIPAVRMRLVEAASRQNNVGVNTVDEIRELLGDEALPNGGTEVLIQSSLIPIGMAGANVEPNEQPPEEQIDEDKSDFQNFYTKMTKVLDEKGERKFSDTYIINSAVTRGIIDDGN